MWREWVNHKRGQSEFLEDAIKRVIPRSLKGAGNFSTPSLTLPQGGREDSFLRSLKGSENFCPQSADAHAEGPVVEDHLRQMFSILTAVVEGELHLCDIEELRRLKGFDGEIDEIEETIKEKAASLEVFILCHDLGKPETIHFLAREGSEGMSKKLHTPLNHAWELDNKNRAKAIELYNKEYKKFAATFLEASPEEIQTAFLSTHQVEITYPGYAHAIAGPRWREVLNQTAEKYRLSPEDTEDIFHVILLHEKVLQDFSLTSKPAVYDHLIKYTLKYGRDADDFLDLVLAAVFLEVCASPHLTAHGINYDLSPVINFLSSEHEALPGKREIRQKKKKEKKLKIEREKFRQAELDGNDLMKLFNMKPSKEFGKLLIEVQAFAKNEKGLPEGVPVAIREELFKRVEKFRSIL